jgi:hypothetical protein
MGSLDEHARGMAAFSLLLGLSGLRGGASFFEAFFLFSRLFSFI